MSPRRALVAALLAFASLPLAGCLGTAGSVAEAPTDLPAPLAVACPEPCEVAVDAGPRRAFEPTAAAHPFDPDFVAVASEEWDALGTRWVHAYVTRDGGATWTKTRLPGGPFEDPSHPLARCTDSFDPVVAVLPDGTVLAGGVASTDGGNAFYRATFVARSTDGGKTFAEVALPTDARRLLGVPTACTPLGATHPLWDFADKPFLAAGRDGAAYLSVQVGGGPWFGRSTDGGRTWEALPPLGDGAPEGAYSAALSVGPTGRLYAAYTEWKGSNPITSGVWLSRLDGDAWTSVKLTDGGNAYPDVAAGPGPTGERVYVSWPEGKNDAKQTPMLVHSDDGGATWSEPVALDAPEEKGWTLPSLDVDGRGVAWSGFFHPLPDGKNEYRVAAYDGSRVFEPTRVDRTPIGRQTLGLSLGHYMGMAGLAEGGAFAVWVSGSGSATDLRGAQARLE